MWDIRRVGRTGSTNADAVAAAQAGAAEGVVIVAEHQDAGRGRLDRQWHTPPGSALTASFILRPDDVPAARWPWLPLLVGVAVVDAVAAATKLVATLKWPNDVLVDDRKLAGILVERVETPSGPAAVAGVGLNVGQQADQIPGTAISLALAGAADPRPGDLLHAVADHLGERYAAWVDAGGDPSAGLAADYRRRCSTLGREVRAELPAGDPLIGRAVDVDESGRLVIATADGSRAVGAGDVVHLRPVRPSGSVVGRNVSGFAHGLFREAPQR